MHSSNCTFTMQNLKTIQTHSTVLVKAENKKEKIKQVTELLTISAIKL